MMSGTVPASPDAPRASVSSPWLIALVVATATFMEVLDTTIANVALRYVAGSLAVSQDEASWVVTSYLVANAIVLAASASLPRLFGRKRFYMVCIAVFTLASVLCGFAWSLPSLLAFRVLQGLGGGGLVPVSQSILTQSFPPEMRGQAFALYGIAVVVAPVVGPTLGGWLSDNLSWHWCFLVNAPVGLLALVLIGLHLPADPSAADRRDQRRRDGFRFDAIGFALIAMFLGSLEIVLDRGQQEDWFASPAIVMFAVTCLLTLALAIPWLRGRKDPILDIRLVTTRQFGACFFVMGLTGAILIATTQFMPQLLQQLYGYTATWAGLALSPGGLVTMAMFVVVGRLSGKIQPKWLIVIGASTTALAMLDLTRIQPGLDFSFFAWSRVLVGLGLPLIFSSINLASYDGVPANRLDQAAALLSVARNVGGSVSVSLAQAVLAQRLQFHQARLVEGIMPANPVYQSALQNLTAHLTARGVPPAQAPARAFGWIGQTVELQVQHLAFIDVFWVLMLMSLSAVPFALLLRKVQGNRPRAAAH